MSRQVEVIKYQIDEVEIQKQLKDSIVLNVLKDIGNTLRDVTSNGLTNVEQKVMNLVNNMEKKYQIVYENWDKRFVIYEKNQKESIIDRTLLKNEVKSTTKKVEGLSKVISKKMRQDKIQGFKRDKNLAKAIEEIKLSLCTEDMKKRCKPVIEAFYAKQKKKAEIIDDVKEFGKSFLNKLLDKLFLIIASLITGIVLTYLIIKHPWIKQYIKAP
jgi:hypothetical protein